MYYILSIRKCIWLGRNEFQNVVVLELHHGIARNTARANINDGCRRGGRAQLLSRAEAALHIPTTGDKGPNCPTSSPAPDFLKILIILVGEKQCLIVGLICIYLKMFSIISCNYCPFVDLWTNAYLYIICPVIIDL